MLIISQNLVKYRMPFPKGTIYRINLAWINNINELVKILKQHENQPIFLDLPIGRVKPPNNKYSMEDLVPLIESYKQIKYFAISNVESPDDMSRHLRLLPNIIIVPKIESPAGINNIKEITDSLRDPKMVMLDHDDLYRVLERKNEASSKFTIYIDKLVDFCKKNNITLLRTRGVIFSDET